MESPTRFIAGSQFYNYAVFGGIRPGGSVSLFSESYVGLAVAAFTSAFVYIGVRSGLLDMVSETMAFTEQQTQAMDRLAEVPAAFGFFVGLVADAIPVCGYHRKSYMVIGMALSLLALLFIGLASWFAQDLREQVSEGVVYLTTFLMGTVSVGSMINFVSVHTMIVILSQRESLETRGVIQANYLIVRAAGQLTARVIVFVIQQVLSEISITLMLAMLVGISIFAMVVVCTHLYETEDITRQSIQRKCESYWRLTKQKAVWHILCFISCFALFLNFKFNYAQDALREWNGVTSKAAILLANIENDAVMIAALCIWRIWLKNKLWRRVFTIAPVMIILPQVIISVISIPDLVRNEVVYTLITGLSGVSTALIALTTLVPVTEVVREGSEGGLVGLAISFYALFKVFASTVMSAMEATTLDSAEDDSKDSVRTRRIVAILQLVTVIVNALSLAGVPFLPVQKLDAQQLRSFGGYTKNAGAVIAIIFLAFVGYCVAYNCILLIPSTACLTLAGGEGCRNLNEQ